jgi:hypothetical protein
MRCDDSPLWFSYFSLDRWHCADRLPCLKNVRPSRLCREYYVQYLYGRKDWTVGWLSPANSRYRDDVFSRVVVYSALIHDLVWWITARNNRKKQDDFPEQSQKTAEIQFHSDHVLLFWSCRLCSHSPIVPNLLSARELADSSRSKLKIGTDSLPHRIVTIQIRIYEYIFLKYIACVFADVAVLSCYLVCFYSLKSGLSRVAQHNIESCWESCTILLGILLFLSGILHATNSRSSRTVVWLAVADPLAF